MWYMYKIEVIHFMDKMLVRQKYYKDISGILISHNIIIISTDEDPSLSIKSFAIKNNFHKIKLV